MELFGVALAASNSALCSPSDILLIYFLAQSAFQIQWCALQTEWEMSCNMPLLEHLPKQLLGYKRSTVRTSDLQGKHTRQTQAVNRRDLWIRNEPILVVFCMRVSAERRCAVQCIAD